MCKPNFLLFSLCFFSSFSFYIPITVEKKSLLQPAGIQVCQVILFYLIYSQSFQNSPLYVYALAFQH